MTFVNNSFLPFISNFYRLMAALVAIGALAASSWAFSAFSLNNSWLSAPS